MALRRRGDCLAPGGPASVRGHRHQRLRRCPGRRADRRRSCCQPMLRKSRKILRKDTTMTAPEIQQEIEQTRDHLGETVDELAVRADVRARARARAAGMKEKAAEMSGQMRQSELTRRRWPLVAAAAGAVLIGSVLIRRRLKR